MITRKLAWLLLASAMFASPDRAQDPQAARPPVPLAIHDISWLTAPHPAVDFHVDLPLWKVYRESVDEPGLEWVDGILSADRLCDLLRNSVAPDSWDEPGRFVMAEEGRLIVAHEAPVLQRIAACLELLRRTVARELDVEIYEVTAESLPAGVGTVLAPAEAEGFLASAKPALRMRHRMLAGIPRRIRAGERVSFLGDYDVEVAQETEIADPLVRVLDDGLDLRLAVDSMAGGGLLVRLGGRRSSLEGFRVFETNSSWVGRIQLPAMDSVLVSSSAVLAPGGAIVVGATRAAADEVFLIRVLAPPPPTDAVEGAVVAIPAAPAGIPRIRQGHLPVGRPARSGATSDGEGSEPDAGGPIYVEADRVLELIKHGVTPERWDADPSMFLVHDGRHIFVKTDAETVGKVRAFHQGLARSVLTTVQLEFRAGRVPDSDLAGIAAGKADLASVAGLLQARAYVVTLAGDDFLAVDGREQGYVKDHDVEVAEDASIADPVVASVFSGTVIHGRVATVDSGTVALQGEYVNQDLVGDIVPFDGNTNDIGLVEVPRTSVSRTSLAGTLRQGAWTLAAIAPRAAGSKDAQVVLVRARW